MSPDVIEIGSFIRFSWTIIPCWKHDEVVAEQIWSGGLVVEPVAFVVSVYKD
jgi:hypothetical protein